MYEIFGHPELVQQFTGIVVTSEITLLLPIAQLYLFVEKGAGGGDDDDLPKTFHILFFVHSPFSERIGCKKSQFSKDSLTLWYQN